MRSFITALFTTTVAAAGSLASQDGQSSANSPATAARVRQDATTTVDVTFRMTEIVAPGGIREAMAGLHKGNHPVPDVPTTLVSPNRLVVAGNKVRYEDNQPIWRISSGTRKEQRRIGLFDGTTAKSYFPAGLGHEGEPVGVIENGSHQDHTKAPELLPLVMSFRGADPAMTKYPIGKLQAAGTAARIDGVACPEFRYVLPKESFTFWFDPQRAHVVRRINRQANGRLEEQWDVQYRQLDSGLWVPESWIRKRYSATGAERSATSIEVLTLRVNESEPDDLFDMRFPPGSVVHDNRTNTSYRVQPDGAMREVARPRDDANGVDPPLGTQWYWRDRWLLV